MLKCLLNNIYIHYQITEVKCGVFKERWVQELVARALDRANKQFGEEH